MRVLFILQSHPIQYATPLFELLAKDPRLKSKVKIKVIYSSGDSAEKFDPEFQRRISWDVGNEGDFESLHLKEWGLRSEGFLKYIGVKAVFEILKSRPDYIFIHGYNHIGNLVAWIFCLLLGVKVLYRSESSVLDIYAPRGKIKKIKFYILRHLISTATRVLYIGSLSREYYRILGINREKLVFFPYTVDNNRFSNDSNLISTKAQNTVLRIIFVGKFVSKKRSMDLLKAVVGIEGFQVTLIGSGPLEGELKKFISDNNICGEVAGFSNQSELPRIYQENDILVLPSSYEPWGLVVNEAMAAGLAVIASDAVCAGHDLLRYFKSKCVFSCGDIDHLRRLLVALKDNPALLQSLKNRSKRVMRRWSYDVNVAAISSAIG